MIEHVIFDYDGVLVDSFNFHLDKYNEIFDIDLTSQELADAHNGNFYGKKSPKFDSVDIEHYSHSVIPEQTKLSLRPGVKETLQLLNRTKTLHLVTSGWSRQILPNLVHHKVDELFEQKMFADHGFSKHQKINQIITIMETTPENCLFITDTLGDILEAHKVPVTVVALSCGFHDRKTLQEGKPDKIFDSWKELDEYLVTI